MGALTPVPLSQGEQLGERFATTNNASSLAELRAISAQKLLEGTARRGTPWFALTIDGYFLPKDPEVAYGSGEQAQVPLLVGWNSEEMNYRAVLVSDEPTLANFTKAVKRLYRDQADQALKLYNPSSSNEVMAVATDLASDRFISYSTWKWAVMQSRTSDQPVYRYYYTRPRPPMRPEMGNATPGLAGGITRGGTNSNPTPVPSGAVHSAEIEYALGNLSYNRVYAWTAEDRKVSETMQSYFANFIKTGNPNGQGLPEWPPLQKGQPARYMRLDVVPRAETEQHRDRYLFLDQVSK